MTEQTKLLPNLRPAMYSHRIAEIQESAYQCGYAIAVHGSMQRDLDLVAIPWTEEAVSATDLVASLCIDIGLQSVQEPPTENPHGRLAYTLMMGGALFIDLSIMPIAPTGTLITEDESTRPAAGQRFLYRTFDAYSNEWSRLLYLDTWDNESDVVTWQAGVIWWPTDNLFNVPEIRSD